MAHASEPAARDVISHEVAVHRVRADYLEMPGLRVTIDQARRLWMLEPSQCRAVLDELVDARFLAISGGGIFVRASG